MKEYGVWSGLDHNMVDFFIAILRELDEHWLRWQREENSRNTEQTRPDRQKRLGKPR